MMPAYSIDQLVLAMVEASQAPTLAEAAVLYAQAGVHVFPTKPRDKSPLFGSHGHLDATTDLDKIRAWWKKHPQANIACSPGRSGLLVIDIDGPDRKEVDGTLKMVADGRKTWEKLRAQFSDTSSYLRTLSPGKGKGQHAWYRYPTGRRIGSPKLLKSPGLQAYGVLGYVMLPPSVHPEGPNYTFDTSCYTVSEVPAWLLDRIPDTSTEEAPTATDAQTEDFISQRSGRGLDIVWQLRVDAEADTIRDADLRHPAVLSAVARVVGWSSAHDDFDLDAGLEILLEALAEAVHGEARNPKAELKSTLNWVVGHELKSIEDARIAEEEAKFGAWPELKELKLTTSGSAALHHLPATIRAVVDTVAEHTQTPPEHAMLAALSTISAATVGKACVDMTWREPGALWTISVAPPSDRKSAVTQLVASGPLAEAMAAVSEGLTEDVRDAEARAKAATARLATIEKNMAKDQPTATLQDWTAAKTELDEIDEPVLPAFLISDATPEAVETVMMEQRGAAAVISAEGALISSLGGRYTEKQKARVGPLNSAFSAEAIHTRRVKGARTIPRPHLSMTLIIQPTVLMEMGSTETFVESGFFARFLYAIPDSKVGRRGNVTPPLKASVMTTWGEKVSDILARFWGQDELSVLPMDAEGMKTIERLRADVERLLSYRSTSPAEHYWLGKAVGQIGRIALMFTLSENPQAAKVPAKHVERAASMFGYLWQQAGAAFGQSVELDGGNLEFARALIRWIERKKLTDFSSRDVNVLGPGRWRRAPEDERDATLRLLAEHGYLKEIPVPASGPKGGRPQSSRWVVSPRLGAEQCTNAEDSCTVVEEAAQVAPEVHRTVSCKDEEVSAQSPIQTNEGDSTSENEVLSQTCSFPNTKREITTTTTDTPYGGPPSPISPSLRKNAAHLLRNLPASDAPIAPPATSEVKDPPAGFGSWDEWCNPNLFRNPVNGYVADGYPKLHPDGSCSRCGSAEVEKVSGFVMCHDCGTSYTAMVISGD